MGLKTTWPSRNMTMPMLENDDFLMDRTIDFVVSVVYTYSSSF